MFNVGGGEFLVIALLALLILGPQRLPDAARQLGKAVGELRRMSGSFQSELRGAFDETPLHPSSPSPDDVRDAHARAGAADCASSVVSQQDREPSAPSRRVRRTPLRAAPDDGAGSSDVTAER